MSATETEETEQTVEMDAQADGQASDAPSDDTPSDDAEAATSEASESPADDTDTEGGAAENAKTEDAEAAEGVDVTMAPPDRVEELFDLANSSLERLDEAATSVTALAKSQQEAVEQSGELAPAFKATMETAAAEALESGGETLKKQIEEAAEETTTALKASLDESRQAVEQMATATGLFKRQMWRNSLFASLAGASIGLIAVLLAGWLMTWWVRGDVDALREERRELVSEVRTLKETADDWASRFGRADVSTCELPGEIERPCVRIDHTAGNFRGEKGEHYRILWGY
ncbi:MAG: hypothetical protein AB8C46_07785 [Burkholderiaceae bacterium]